ncbi:LLM class flavin-dependent oxidoreductase [Elongatibacter sediminis]|uniref:LLM class flavin-dependent oxidoreductase n=1 Tax=Elongatibacter sediminis TaxID=3119006 RepID=A0AAW9RC33_9GAMM
MKFGIRLIDYLGSVRRRVELTVLAEQAGFDFAWYPHDTFMHNTWVLTSAAAVATSRIRLGSVGTNPFTTNPAEIATYIASLDELSGGRAVLGLGLHTHEMVEWTGVDASESVAATREATEIIRALLRGEVVDYQGEIFQWTDQCYLRLEPVRREVPIYVCAFGPDYLALSGAIGDGSLPMITPPESAAYMVPAITGGAVAAGRDPAEVDISGCAWLSLAADPSAPTDVLRRMVSYFGWGLEAPALATIGLTPADFAPIKTHIDAGDYAGAEALVTDDMCRLALAGTPRQVIGQIERLAELGVTHVNLGGPLGPDPAEAIRLMGEQVIPYFRSST